MKVKFDKEAFWQRSILAKKHFGEECAWWLLLL